MIRHLKIRGEFDPLRELVVCTVIEQTHYGRSFGGDKDYFVVGSKGAKDAHYLICPVSTPTARLHNYQKDAYMKPKEDKPVLDILVKTTPEDECTFTATVAEWEVVKEVVTAYNEWGAKEVKS